MDDADDRIRQLTVCPEQGRMGEFVLQHDIDIDIQSIPEPWRRVVEESPRVSPPGQLNEFNGIAGRSKPLE
jgi:hypothetical protein